MHFVGYEEFGQRYLAGRREKTTTTEYIGEWEVLYNPHFDYTEFGTIKNEAGSNNFVLSVKQWIEKTGAVGIPAKAGRYGGTYAHKDLAFFEGVYNAIVLQIMVRPIDIIELTGYGQ
jgi:hypothetical protein